MREHLRYMSNMISELAKMGYDLTDEQQFHAVIRSLPSDLGHIKMALPQTMQILTFEDIRRRFELGKEQQEAVKMISAEVHISTFNSKNGSKKKDQGNQIDKTQSNEETEHDQQGKEKCVRKKDLMEAKYLNYDQMGHHARGCTEPHKVLSNISQ